MAKLIALYKKPADAAAFDRYYRETHTPLAKTLPGLRRYEVGTPAGETPLHLVAILSFDSMDAIQAALKSPEGAATAGDLANFAQAGVDLVMFDTKEV
jgi:uncharacterized protein (TIGR02118 family)